MGVNKVGWEPSEKLLRELERYRGKWVVIVGERVIVADEDHDVLTNAVRAEHIDWDSIEYVPTGDEPPLIL